MKPVKRRKKLKVSIITVCLNSVNTIEQTIQSVLNQTYKDIEYIVIDGGSNDGTCEIIEKYKNQITYYVSEPDNGIYFAMNKGINQASGDIIGILNSDDWYDLYTIGRVVETFEKYDCDMLHGKLSIVYADNLNRIVDERKLDDLYVGMNIAHPTVFVKHEVYDKYGVFNERYISASDYELMLRLYTLGIDIKFVPYVLTYFRLGGFSQKKEMVNIEESYQISRHYIEKYKSLDKSVWLNKLEYIYSYKMKRVQLKNVIANFDSEVRGEIVSLLGNHIAIFGTGNYGIVCYELLKFLAVNFDVWIDNNVVKQKSTLLEKRIVSLQEAIEKSDMIIIASKDYENEMREQILSYRIDNIKYMSLFDLEKVILAYGQK